jgi:hypothetical protein
MNKAAKSILVSSVVLMAVSSVFAQGKPIRLERRPAGAAAETPAAPLPQPTYEFFSILDGTPISLELHHDTVAGTGKPIDVYVFAIELQVLNSDGDLEPEGLIFDNFYTAKAVDPNTAPNPNNARDCKTWNSLVSAEIAIRKSGEPVWPYVEFTTALGARTIQTNEDGQVWWSDDVECWGSSDRFPPF